MIMTLITIYNQVVENKIVKEVREDNLPLDYEEDPIEDSTCFLTHPSLEDLALFKEDLSAQLKVCQKQKIQAIKEKISTTDKYINKCQKKLNRIKFAHKAINKVNIPLKELPLLFFPIKKPWQYLLGKISRSLQGKRMNEITITHEKEPMRCDLVIAHKQLKTQQAWLCLSLEQQGDEDDIKDIPAGLT